MKYSKITKKTDLLFLCTAAFLIVLSCEEENVSEDGLSGSISANIEGEDPFVGLPLFTSVSGTGDKDEVLKTFTITAADKSARRLIISLGGDIFTGEQKIEIRGYGKENKSIELSFGNKEGAWSAGIDEDDETVMGEVDIYDIEDNVMNATFFLPVLTKRAKPKRLPKVSLPLNRISKILHIYRARNF